MFGALGQAADHRQQVIFAGGVEAADLGGILLARQAIGTHHQRLAVFVMGVAVRAYNR